MVASSARFWPKSSLLRMEPEVLRELRHRQLRSAVAHRDGRFVAPRVDDMQRVAAGHLQRDLPVHRAFVAQHDGVAVDPMVPQRRIDLIAR
jgi:hypothetical protein